MIGTGSFTKPNSWLLCEPTEVNTDAQWDLSPLTKGTIAMCDGGSRLCLVRPLDPLFLVMGFVRPTRILLGHKIKRPNMLSRTQIARGNETHRFPTTFTLSDFPLLIGETLRRSDLRSERRAKPRERIRKIKGMFATR